MKSTATPRFWHLLNALPAEVQALAEKNYRLWVDDPQHPSLHFKRLAGSGHRFSVRVGDHYRAIGWRLAMVVSSGFGSGHMQTTIFF